MGKGKLKKQIRAWLIYGFALLGSIVMIWVGTPERVKSLRAVIGSVGSGVLASALVAALLEWKQWLDHAAEMRERRKDYFGNLRSEVQTVLARILWYEDRRAEANFNWNLSPEDYWKRSFYIPISANNYRQSWTYEEGINRLKSIQQSFSDGSLSVKDRLVYEKMFKIMHGMRRTS